MEGLYIGQNNKYIEKVNMEAHELSLLARGDGVEVLLQRVKANEVFYVEPSDNGELMEYFHIINGELTYDPGNEKITLKSGEYFYVHGIKEPKVFRTVTDVTLLYVSSQPVFQFLSSAMKDLTDILNKIEEKDMYTRNHCLRVREYALKIGTKLYLSKGRLEKIGWASLMHDIGKVHVPDDILNKPSKLTESEMNCMKKHPSDGEVLVKGTMYEDIHNIIGQHHERLDGSGYPYGLLGDEILIEAKIISVADTYDAMTTDRPYRKGFSPRTAMEELKRLRGIHYESKVVDAFEKILVEDGILSDELPGNSISSLS